MNWDPRWYIRAFIHTDRQTTVTIATVDRCSEKYYLILHAMNTKHWYPILKKPQFKLDFASSKVFRYEIFKYIDMNWQSNFYFRDLKVIPAIPGSRSVWLYIKIIVIRTLLLTKKYSHDKKRKQPILCLKYLKNFDALRTRYLNIFVFVIIMLKWTVRNYLTMPWMWFELYVNN